MGFIYYVPAGSVLLQLGPWAPEALLPVIEALLARQILFPFSLNCLYLPWLLEGTVTVLTEPCAE
jgi:hypothetical protein